MSDPALRPDRRAFVGAAAGLLGLGFDLRAAQAEVRQSRFKNTREYPGVCPYCAVGCGQLISVRDGKIVNIEGNPDSPINRGTLCPKGAATYQLVVNPNRVTKVWYRAPGATEWDKSKTLDWAMDRIARLLKDARDRDLVERNSDGLAVNHLKTVASLGGATLDNEENYLLKKLFTGGLGMLPIENQARL